jgi:type II secretory pathway predicted ATPase ExeA
MYQAHFGLADLPFRIAPDPKFYFDSGQFQSARSTLEQALSDGDAFVAVIGDIGSGKTTVVRRFVDALDRSRIAVGEVVTSQLEGDDLLRVIADSFDVEPGEPGELLQRLQQWLRETGGQQREALLVIDEAQNLTLFSLQQLQALTDIRRGARPVLHIVLVGEFPPSPLEDARHEGVPVEARRIVKLGPLDRELTREYVLHRLAKAGWSGPPLFPVYATDAVFECSGGIPRRINRLCDRVLLRLFMEQGHEVSVGLVRMVHDLLQAELSGSGTGSMSDGRARAVLDAALASRPASPFAAGVGEVDDAGPAKVAGVSQMQESVDGTMSGDTVTIVQPRATGGFLSSSSQHVPLQPAPAAPVVVSPTGSRFAPSVAPMAVPPLPPRTASPTAPPIGLVRATASEPAAATMSQQVRGRTSSRTAILLMLAAGLAVAIGGTAAWKLLHKHSQGALEASAPMPAAPVTGTAIEGSKGTGPKTLSAVPAAAPATPVPEPSPPTVSTGGGEGERSGVSTAPLPSTTQVEATLPPPAVRPNVGAAEKAAGAGDTNLGALPPTSAGVLAPAARRPGPRVEARITDSRRDTRRLSRPRTNTNSAATGQGQSQARHSRDAAEQPFSACTPVAEVMGLCASAPRPARSPEAPAPAKQACDSARSVLGLCAADR